MNLDLLAAMTAVPLPPGEQLTTGQHERLHAAHDRLHRAATTPGQDDPWEVLWGAQDLAEATNRILLARIGVILGDDAPYTTVALEALKYSRNVPSLPGAPQSPTITAMTHSLDLLAELADAPYRPDIDYHLVTAAQTAVTWTHHLLERDFIHPLAPHVTDLESGNRLTSELFLDLNLNLTDPSHGPTLTDHQTRRLGVAIGRYQSLHGIGCEEASAFRPGSTHDTWPLHFREGLAYGILFDPEETVALNGPSPSDAHHAINAVLAVVRNAATSTDFSKDITTAITNATFTGPRANLAAAHEALTEDLRHLPAFSQTPWENVLTHLAAALKNNHA